MSNHRFVPEPYKGKNTRHECPSCEEKHQFTRYIDVATNKYLAADVGICNRKIKCGYHYPPKQYFKDQGKEDLKFKTARISKRIEMNHPKTSLINHDEMLKTIDYKKKNNFTEFLSNLPGWDYEIAFDLAQKYNVGSIRYFGDNATIFWQVDANNKVRTGKILLYNKLTGKRIKKPFNHITWTHITLKIENFNLNQCLFGEHLLKSDKHKPVAIVESEKTAIICSVLLPDFIWLATGGITNLKHEKTEVLNGRNVVLWPDANCFDLWNNKISELNNLATYRTSSLLRDKATDKEKENGLDIADYLLNML